MGMETKVDDVPHTETPDFCELRLGRLNQRSLSDRPDDASCKCLQGRPLETPHMNV